MIFLQISDVVEKVAEEAATHNDRMLLIWMVVAVITALCAALTKLYTDSRKDRKEYLRSMDGITHAINAAIEQQTSSMKDIIANSHAQLQVTIQSALSGFGKTLEDNNKIADKIIDKLKL